jgi:2-keto-4-pentenoate hydratase/2-oxohepta-3-ene-1,7-dioic acid hydratase in catechol pathway
MTFRLANVAGRASLVDGDHHYDLEAATSGRLGPDPMRAVESFRTLHDVDLTDLEPTGSLAEATLGPPVPTPTNCFGIGLNYRSHVAEAAMDLPTAPVVFAKFPSCIAPPDTDVVLVGDAVDYEAELVVVIGEGGRDIRAADAWTHVAGVTAGQDISDRALQFAADPPHFDLGKSRDTFGPLGPVLVSPDAFADPDDIAVECSVNGERRQSATTAQLIFSVPFLVEYLSAVMTLHPGDVIFTGTPEGVGIASGNLLRPGDLIETTLAGIGTLTNRCVDRPGS